MRAYVFTDGALERQAGRFVWLSIDAEKERNAPFKTRFAITALPTFFVIDPADEKAAMRWVGGATLPQLLKLLDDGARSVKPPAGKLEETLARADRHYGEARWAEAAAAYQEVLAAAGKSWKPRARTTESLLFALSSAKRSEECAVAAWKALPEVRKTFSSANVAGSGLSCALGLPAEHPRRAELVSNLEKASQEILADSRLRLAADDRSGLYDVLHSAREEAKDEAGARRVASEWATYLEKEAAKAKTPDARAVFDSHRLGAYLALGEPARALPMLEASERDLPGDYNPPARLAVALRDLKRWDEALAASDRALAKAYGPRKLGIYRTRTDIYVGKGDAAAARKTVEEALRFAESLPAGQRSEGAIASLKKKLESMP